MLKEGILFEDSEFTLSFNIGSILYEHLKLEVTRKGPRAAR